MSAPKVVMEADRLVGSEYTGCGAEGMDLLGRRRGRGSWPGLEWEAGVDGKPEEATVRVLVNAVGAVTGGAVRHLAPFLRALRSARPEWGIYLCASTGAVEVERDIVRECRIVPGRGLGSRLLWDFTGIARTAEEVGADCIVNLTNTGPVRSPVPSILYQRNPIYFDPEWVRRLSYSKRLKAWTRRALAFQEMESASVVVTPSHAMAGWLRFWTGKQLRIETIPHGVDGMRFAYRPRVPHLGEGCCLLMVGVPAMHKGMSTAVDALSHLVKGGIDARLRLTVSPDVDKAIEKSHHVPHDSSYARDLLHYIRRSGMRDRVELSGNHDQIEDLYRTSDILLSTSYTESFGFTVLEGMASGLPVVGSSIPATAELLGDSGWYFVPGNAEGLVAAVKQILSGPQGEIEAKLMRARERALQLSWKSNAERVAQLVEDCTERTGRM